MTVERCLADSTKIADPLERAGRLHSVVLPAVDRLRDRVVDARAAAVAEANDAGVGYRRIAAELGVSTSRAQQLVAEGRRVRAGQRRYTPQTRHTEVDEG